MNKSSHTSGLPAAPKSSGAARLERPAEGAITLVIVESDPTIGESLRALLEGVPELNCVAVHVHVAEALLALPGLLPDVLLLDDQLLTLNGTGLITKFRACSPATQILILTTFDSGGLSFESVCEGARGDLPKTTPAAELFQAVRWVHAGGSLLSMLVARRVIALLEATTARVEGVCQLDRLEREVIAARSRGMLYPMIAREHGMGVPAVLAVFRGVFEKLAAAGVSHEMRTAGFP